MSATGTHTKEIDNSSMNRSKCLPSIRPESLWRVVDAPLLKDFVFTDKEREPMALAPAFIEDSCRFQKASIA
jgi:hypothetical protein